MHYEQREKIKELENFITTYTIDRGNRYEEKEALEEEFKWRASLFLAKAVHLAKPKNQTCSLDQFNQFKSEYEQDNDKEINTDGLFQKFWLRNVLGDIKIAGTVSSACTRFQKIQNYKNELTFLSSSFPNGVDRNAKLSKHDFEKIRKEYEKKNNLTLSDEGLYQPNWLSALEETVEISNINVYFKPYLDYWEEFKFLCAYQKQISQYDDKGLKIVKEALDQLHQSFSSFYYKTPPIQKLIDEEVLIPEDGFYCLNFYNTKIQYWSGLADQITANYWQLLIDDNAFNSDEERLRRFINQILYYDWASNSLYHSTDESKRRFLQAAFDLVKNETDLYGIDLEFKKISIDQRFSSSDIHFLFHNREAHDDYSLDNSDHFELLKSLDRWEEKAHTNNLHNQCCRKELSYLIRVITKNDYLIEREEIDDEDKPTFHHFQRIFVLLNEAINKPTLLWKIVQCIILNRREVLPYLIAEKKFTSLSFWIVDQIIKKDHLPIDERQILAIKLWGNCTGLALHVAREHVKNGEAAKLIFQIYRQLNYNKYDIPYNRQSKKAEQLSRKQKEEKERIVLSLIEDSPMFNHSMYSGNQQYLLPEIFNELVDLFVNFESRSLYKNGTIHFPMLQWDALAWLLKCSTYWKYKGQFNIKIPNTHELTHSFFKLYVDRIEVTGVKKYNFFDKKEEEGLPLWSEKIERLEYIEWLYPIYFIYKQQKLNSFLEPRFYFSPTKDHYHKENHFTADKLRTHLGVLIQVLRQLVLPIIPYGFEKDDLLEIKSRIEQQIIDYIKSHIRDIPEEGRIDLFDYNKEWAFNNSEKEALLPQLARALNWFENKNSFIEAIIKSQDIVKILTVAEWITSEGVKEKLIEKIQQSDIKSFLEEIHWIPEVQQTLIRISQYPELIRQINNIVEYWKENVSKKNHQYEVQLYQTRMLLSYFNRDEKELDTIKQPTKANTTRINEISYADHKQFYRALIRLEKEPVSSYAIFDQLSTQYLQYPVFALNRMAAKINMAREKNNDLGLYRETLEEWNNYAFQRGELDSESLGSTFFVNKLFVLLKLGEHQELDKTFSQLEMPYQMLPEVLDVKIDSLVLRNRLEEALMILERAEIYHQFSGYEEVAFIKVLKNKVSGIDDVAILNSYYSRIFASPPSKLIRIFPDNINGYRSIQSFVTKEIAKAASKMLDKVVSISEILGEDKYNDIVELSLDARINPWGWYVGEQSRGGFSDPKNKSVKKQPGERDLPIHDTNKEIFCICEAFIYRKPATAKSHLIKIFSYYHQRETLIMLIYDLEETVKSKKNWDNYVNNILPSTDFPEGYELITCEDVTAEFGYQKSAIKIAKSIHKNEIVLYHIFVNINYKVS